MKRFWLILLLLFSTHLFCEDDAYRIKVGDVFRIQVYNSAKTRFEVQVNPDGKISYYLSPSLYVLGMTIDELRAALIENLKAYYIDPILIINPIHFSSSYATIFGEVVNPGVQDINVPTNIIQAVAKARGFKRIRFRNQYVETVDLEKSFLMREGALVPADFEGLFRKGDISQNISLQKGDLLYFPSKFIKKIYVLGRVRDPRSLGFLQQVTVVEAIAEAGGLMHQANSLIMVIRGSLYAPVTFTLNIDKILRGQAPNFILEAGDIVYVPTYTFQTLKELLQAGIFAFATSVALNAGEAAYIAIQPKAANLNGIQGTIPVTPAATGGGGGGGGGGVVSP